MIRPSRNLPLRCLVLTAAILPVAGCGPDPMAGREDAAAEAAGQALAPDRLARWVAAVPTGQPTVAEAGFVSLVWVDYTLLGLAVARDEPLADSVTAWAALEPDRDRIALRRWHDTLVARRPRVPSEIADTAFERGRVRLFQHILLPVTDPNDVRQIGAARAQAESLLVRVRSGAPFDSLARAISRDPTGATGGYLGVGERGRYFPEFERVAWQLRPDQVQGAGTRLGVHLIRRPGMAEARPFFLAYAESLATLRRDSLHLDSLRSAKNYRPSPNLLRIMRGFFADPGTRATVQEPVASWDGGALTLAQVALWADLLRPSSYYDLRNASDIITERFVRDLAGQYLLLEEARTAGIQVTQADWPPLYEGYRRGLRESLALLGVTDSTGALPEAEVPGRVAAMLDGVTSDRARWRPLPSALGSVLRARGGYRLHGAGLERAARAAYELTVSDSALRARRDTTGPR